MKNEIETSQHAALLACEQIFASFKHLLDSPFAFCHFLEFWKITEMTLHHTGVCC